MAPLPPLPEIGDSCSMSRDICPEHGYVVRCGDDYIIRKIAREDEYHDGHQTEIAIKRHIIRLRRHGMLRRDQAREEWDLILNEDVQSREGFAMWWTRTGLEMAHELQVSDFSPRVRAFMKRVIPRLRAVIREQLAAEAA